MKIYYLLDMIADIIFAIMWILIGIFMLPLNCLLSFLFAIAAAIALDNFCHHHFLYIEWKNLEKDESRLMEDDTPDK